ncbi:hypothetical protein [Pseudoxanthomonas sacheonensis]|uniref:Transmembrane protein n=1 Tax=Pseudoxanthomonas sacheonensis TaxID=443615 RepID=A0ABU1RVZ8_9GAMM|nr:hypothetical protein [Pseudoxanthomonas sacheonensis]MDR6842956.1 hypothetical protein [Pseudoxanthomonas sacheonensis]
MQETTLTHRPIRWLALVMLLLGGLCFAVIWIMLAVYLGKPCGWMAVLGALDAAVMLRLGGMRGGAGRTLLAVLATLAIIALVNWGTAATQIGFAMGLNPWDSALKLGMGYAWTLFQLANQTADRIWMAVALVAAAVAAR